MKSLSETFDPTKFLILRLIQRLPIQRNSLVLQSVFSTVAPMKYVISLNYDPNAIHFQNQFVINFVIFQEGIKQIE